MELYKSCQINRWVCRPKTLNINDEIDYFRLWELKNLPCIERIDDILIYFKRAMSRGSHYS